ncbi:hypothetical protein [Catellatospora citrea]|uniref:Uncharacterized protein n=1 Tax=Catellatospora citrea TaxID=53366 RepID=A0A8J3P2V6_9ACTN|nr:hypothetical protein [Catellatospora citrea]RKE02729.1 hypothetical protein C8E86_8038 [Catellatospora citrea]GIF99560.1 hypothetical protein Cci01nite_46540 [Catellatospora citrea]
MLDRFRITGRSLVVAVLTAALTTAGLAAPTPAGAAVTQAQLALRWAPIHYQDVDATGSHALSGRSDYITKVDFDGDLNGRNNWDRTGQAGVSLAAHVYYSVVETGTHWYLTYLFYHPRDWTDHPFFETEHENDGEGVLLVVERDGSDYGVLRAAVTVAHTDFYSYTPSGSTWSSGRESVDGTLQLQSSPHDGFLHPVTAQEAKGHGLKAYPQYNINGDGLVYYPSTVAETPSSGDDRDVRYQLIDIFASGGLWAQRANTSLFASAGTFAGDDSGDCGAGTYDCTTNSANAPWGWDDGNDLPGRGQLATDPAKVAVEYFTVPGALSRTYTSNAYAG